MLMNNRWIHQAGLVVTMALLSSCAYMQTHKNIAEAGRQRVGYHLQSPLKLYRAGEQYYLEAEQQQLRIHYPVIHDSIFLNGNNDPVFYNIGEQNTTVYFPISKGTGQVMQREDGYVELETLKSEISESRAECSCTLPGGSQECSIRALVQGEPATWADSKAEVPGSTIANIASALDQVIIDWPGTVLYNAAIPVMAPFVFFHQFLTEE